MQDHAQGHYKNSASSGQCFKHDRVQGHPQDPQTSSRALCFPIAYPHPGINIIALYSHPLKDSLSIQCKCFVEHIVKFGLLRV